MWWKKSFCFDNEVSLTAIIPLDVLTAATTAFTFPVSRAIAAFVLNVLSIKAVFVFVLTSPMAAMIVAVVPAAALAALALPALAPASVKSVADASGVRAATALLAAATVALIATAATDAVGVMADAKCSFWVRENSPACSVGVSLYRLEHGVEPVVGVDCL